MNIFFFLVVLGISSSAFGQQQKYAYAEHVIIHVEEGCLEDLTKNCQTQTYQLPGWRRIFQYYGTRPPQSQDQVREMFIHEMVSREGESSIRTLQAGMDDGAPSPCQFYEMGGPCADFDEDSTGQGQDGSVLQDSFMQYGQWTRGDLDPGLRVLQNIWDGGGDEDNRQATQELDAFKRNLDRRLADLDRDKETQKQESELLESARIEEQEEILANLGANQALIVSITQKSKELAGSTRQTYQDRLDDLLGEDGVNEDHIRRFMVNFGLMDRFSKDIPPEYKAFYTNEEIEEAFGYLPKDPEERRLLQQVYQQTLKSHVAYKRASQRLKEAIGKGQLDITLESEPHLQMMQSFVLIKLYSAGGMGAVRQGHPSSQWIRDPEMRKKIMKAFLDDATSGRYFLEGFTNSFQTSAIRTFDDLKTIASTAVEDPAKLAGAVVDTVRDFNVFEYMDGVARDVRKEWKILDDGNSEEKGAAIGRIGFKLFEGALDRLGKGAVSKGAKTFAASKSVEALKGKVRTAVDRARKEIREIDGVLVDTSLIFQHTVTGDFSHTRAWQLADFLKGQPNSQALEAAGAMYRTSRPYFEKVVDELQNGPLAGQLLGKARGMILDPEKIARRVRAQDTPEESRNFFEGEERYLFQTPQNTSIFGVEFESGGQRQKVLLAYVPADGDEFSRRTGQKGSKILSVELVEIPSGQELVMGYLRSGAPDFVIWTEVVLPGLMKLPFVEK